MFKDKSVHHKERGYKQTVKYKYGNCKFIT